MRSTATTASTRRRIRGVTTGGASNGVWPVIVRGRVVIARKRRVVEDGGWVEIAMGRVYVRRVVSYLPTAIGRIRISIFVPREEDRGGAKHRRPRLPA